MRPIDGPPEAIDALDRRWEVRLGAGDDPGPVPALDPGLALALDHLYALDDAPGVDPAFVRRLEERLMSGTSAAAPSTRRVRSILFGHTPRLAWPAGRTKASSDSRSFGAVVTAAALLLVVLAVGLVTMRLGDNNSDVGSIIATTDFEGSPTAEECDIPPRTAAPPPIAGTPSPSPIEAAEVIPSTQLGLAPSDVPSGPPASPEGNRRD